MSLRLLNWTYRRMQASDVLLGMDFLQQFHLTLYGNTFILSN